MRGTVLFLASWLSMAALIALLADGNIVAFILFLFLLKFLLGVAAALEN